MVTILHADVSNWLLLHGFSLWRHAWMLTCSSTINHLHFTTPLWHCGDFLKNFLRCDVFSMNSMLVQWVGHLLVLTEWIQWLVGTVNPQANHQTLPAAPVSVWPEAPLFSTDRGLGLASHFPRIQKVLILISPHLLFISICLYVFPLQLFKSHFVISASSQQTTVGL